MTESLVPIHAAASEMAAIPTKRRRSCCGCANIHVSPRSERKTWPADLCPRASAYPLAAQRLEARTQLFREELRLLPAGEVPALGQLVVVDQLWIGLLGPTPRRRVEFVREHAHGSRDGDALDVEIPLAPVLPVETGAGNPGGRQPGERDVVEDVVAGEALVLSVEDPSDQLQAARVVIEEVRRQADGRIRDSVQRLRSQAHLVPVADALLIDELQPVVRHFLIG